MEGAIFWPKECWKRSTMWRASVTRSLTWCPGARRCCRAGQRPTSFCGTAPDPRRLNSPRRRQDARSQVAPRAVTMQPRRKRRKVSGYASLHKACRDRKAAPLRRKSARMPLGGGARNPASNAWLAPLETMTSLRCMGGWTATGLAAPLACSTTTLTAPCCVFWRPWSATLGRTSSGNPKGAILQAHQLRRPGLQLRLPSHGRWICRLLSPPAPQGSVSTNSCGPWRESRFLVIGPSRLNSTPSTTGLG
mmetsp:Transcript_33752/g.96813  ORF Transcript_33752/g.96813 Transcript_33752/m.96813 type:complete len:249 (-) Transcript_33752:943-1689(-)